MIHGAHALNKTSPAGQVDAGGGDVSHVIRALQDDNGLLSDSPLKQGRAPALAHTAEALHELGQAPHHGQPQHERRRHAGENKLPAGCTASAVLAGGRIDQCEMTVVRRGPAPLAGGDIDAGGDPVPGVIALRPHPAHTHVLRGQADGRGGAVAAAGGTTGAGGEGVEAH